MAVSPEDRARWDRQVAALREAETESRGSPEWRAEVFRAANAWRATHGIPPLLDEFDNIPEAELHRRAEHLGLLRRST